ncbi:MAG: hypothetical protein J6M34_07920 [Clostridia bacterium]|nr:hypothetical protein [Clostridia bacterium]
MIKKCFVLFLTAVLVLSLAACAADPAEESPSEDFTRTERTDLTSVSDSLSEPSDTDAIFSETASEASEPPATEEISDGPAENRDVLTTPIAYMTDSEEAELAQYLFERYVPCCFGVFESVSDLTSTSLWTSVVALNETVDRAPAEEAGKLENVKAKIARYYPGSTFNPAEVRMFNEETQTFPAIPITLQEYVFLSSERQGDAITVYYRDVPADDSEPGQYATTLKKSTESGYFSFVSTRRVGAVG